MFVHVVDGGVDMYYCKNLVYHGLIVPTDGSCNMHAVRLQKITLTNHMVYCEKIALFILDFLHNPQVQ